MLIAALNRNPIFQNKEIKDMNWTKDASYDNCNYDIDTFDELPDQIQRDLREWFNSEPDEDEKQQLLKLYVDGNFHAWNYAECGNRVFDGQPHNWDYFQGAQNRDFSFFGNRDKYQADYLDALCDNCRMTS